MQIKLTKPQTEFFTAQERFVAMVSGFGAGKTTTLVLKMLADKFEMPKVSLGYFAPTYPLIRDILYPKVTEYLEMMGVGYRINKAENNIYIDGYGVIVCRTMDKPERIVGFQIGNAYLDEFDTLKTENALQVWQKVIARIRQAMPKGQSNRILVATTPEGHKATYQLFKKEPKPNYRLIQASTYSNPYLPEGYADSLKEIYPDNLINAYLNGEFVNLTNGTVFNEYDRDKNRSNEEVKEGELLRIGMDFNVTNMSAVVYVKREESYHAVDEFYGVFDTPSMIYAIKEKYPNHTIYVYPDASGRSRKTVDASISDISLLEQANFRVYAHNSNPFIKDRVLAANVAFKQKLLYINDSKCKELARCFELLAYDNAGKPDKSSGYDHLTDAATYPVAYELPINKPAHNVPINFTI